MHITNIALAIALGITPQMATTVQATIHGDYGNGIERVQRLGAQYDDIQQAINKLYATTPQATPQATPTPQATDPIPTPTPQATPQATPTWHDGLPACTDEDGSGQASCYWDAQTRGNHQGHSYTITNGITHYIN